MDARLQFLRCSAQFYASLSSPLSAHLMLQCIANVAEKDSTSPKSGSQPVCNACGTIMIPGKNCTITVGKQEDHSKSCTSTRKVAKKPERPLSFANKSIVVECHSCGRTTKSLLPRKTMSSRSRGLRQEQAVVASAVVDSPSTNSKGRMKVRKEKAKERKRGGLQALLAKSKDDSKISTGFGLDLMDLMKQS